MSEKRRIVQVLLLALLVAGTGGASAQVDFGLPSEDFGRVLRPDATEVPPDMEGEPEAERFSITEADQQGKTLYLLGPSYVDSDSSSRTGLAAGMVIKTVRRSAAGGTEAGTSVTALGQYANLGTEDGSLSTDLSVALLKFARPFRRPEFGTLGLALVYADVKDISRTEEVQLLWEKKLGKLGTSLNLNAGWAEQKPDGGTAVDDAKFSAGLLFNPSMLKGMSVGVDYGLENDISGEDSFGITFNQTLLVGGTLSKIKFGVSKHGTMSLGYTAIFGAS